VTPASKSRQPPAPIIALLVDVSAAAEDLEPLKAAVLQVKTPFSFSTMHLLGNSLNLVLACLRQPQPQPCPNN